MQTDDLTQRMCGLVADALALDEDEVKADSRLMADLKADSLDFVDILFQIDKNFGVKLQPGDLDFLRRLDPGATETGPLTAERVQEVQKWIPAIADLPEPEKATPKQLFSLISVETLCRVVQAERGAHTAN